MSEFTASNGIPVRSCEGVHTIEVNGVFVRDDLAQALREFFQAERDAELGRWRWPENPEYVVYALPDGGVDVLRESSVSDSLKGPGRLQGISRWDAGGRESAASSHFYAAAAAYFAAHPEPKPWHDAKPGEVWVLTTENVGDECAARVAEVNGQRVFEWVAGLHRKSVVASTITAGRRIWPEVTS